MTHPEELLAGFVAGSLSEGEREEVRTHLATCERCSKDVAAATDARDALRALPLVEAPAEVVASIVREAGPSASGHARKGRRGWYGWVGAAAAAAALALILTNLPHPGVSTHDSTQEKTSLGAGAATRPTIAESTMLQLIVRPVDYNASTLNQLMAATAASDGAAGLAPAATGSSSPSPTGERIGTGAELQTAITCVGRAVPANAGQPFQLILARYEGKPAFLAFYYRGAGVSTAPTSLVVWIVDGHTCTASGLSSTKL